MKRLDLVIMVGLVIILASVFGYNYLQQQRSQGQAGQLSAGIYVDGQRFQTVSLTDDVDVIELETEYGRNVLRVRDEGIEMIEADCPDQLCINFGFKQTVRDLIVCLPNRVHVVLEGEGERETDN